MMSHVNAPPTQTERRDKAPPAPQNGANASQTKAERHYKAPPASKNGMNAPPTGKIDFSSSQKA